MQRKPKKNKEFEHIATILPKVLTTYRQHQDSAVVEVWNFWNQAVGGIIAEHAQPAAFKGSLLLVHVSNSTWIHQLQFLKQGIIAKINAALGETRIKDIKFKIGPI